MVYKYGDHRYRYDHVFLRVSPNRTAPSRAHLDGQYKDILYMTSREANGVPRLKASGKLKGFRFFEVDRKPEPKTALYDWLYINALHKHPELVEYVLQHKTFSDIAFNPERSLNCQVFSAALYVSLYKKDLLTPSVLKHKETYLEAFRGIKSTAERRGRQQACL